MQDYDFDELEVQLGYSKEIRGFKNVSEFKQNGMDIEFYYEGFDPDSWEGNKFTKFRSHAELHGKVVSRIRRCGKEE